MRLSGKIRAYIGETEDHTRKLGSVLRNDELFARFSYDIHLQGIYLLRGKSSYGHLAEVRWETERGGQIREV